MNEPFEFIGALVVNGDDHSVVLAYQGQEIVVVVSEDGSSLDFVHLGRTSVEDMDNVVRLMAAKRA